MALARLKLLCRRAKALPADVLRLVRAYLCFYVQWHVPLWVEWLLEDKIRALPRCGTRSRSVLIVLATSARIPVADYRPDQNSLRDTGPLTRPFAVDYPVTVMVKIVVKYKPWESNLPQTRWELVCQQGIVVLRRVSSGWSSWGPLTALINIRNCFTTSAPYGYVEVPVTWPGWRRYVDRYLFGPAAPRLALEPRRDPEVEICSDCSNTLAAAPAQRVHAHGKVFCSRWCLEAHMMLLCSQCLEPLIDGQGLCRPCLLAAQRAFWAANAR